VEGHSQFKFLGPGACLQAGNKMVGVLDEGTRQDT
jgi:hypothetical protein